MANKQTARAYHLRAISVKLHTDVQVYQSLCPLYLKIYARVLEGCWSSFKAGATTPCADYKLQWQEQTPCTPRLDTILSVHLMESWPVCAMILRAARSPCVKTSLLWSRPSHGERR
jgi:hypothetical protein